MFLDFFVIMLIFLSNYCLFSHCILYDKKVTESENLIQILHNFITLLYFFESTNYHCITIFKDLCPLKNKGLINQGLVRKSLGLVERVKSQHRDRHHKQIGIEKQPVIQMSLKQRILKFGGKQYFKKQQQSRLQDPDNWTLQNLPELIRNTKFSKLDAECSKMVVLMGSTRSGKSTLTNLMSGVPMKGFVDQIDRNKMKVEVDEPTRDYCPIGHSLDMSETLIPNFMKVYPEHKAYLFCDCPGFSDSRGTTIDIFNSFTIAKIFRANKQIKPVLVLTEDSLNEGGANFVGPLNRLSGLFVEKEDFQALLNSFVMIFTKTENQDEERIFLTNRLQNIKEKNRKLTEKSKKLIESCINHKNVGFFLKPNLEGQICEDNKQELLKLVTSGHSISLRGQINLKLDDGAKLQLQRYFSEVKNQIEEQVQINAKQLQKFYEDFMNQNLENKQKLSEEQQNMIGILEGTKSDTKLFIQLLIQLDKEKRIVFVDQYLSSQLELLNFYVHQNIEFIKLELLQSQLRIVKVLENALNLINQKLIEFEKERADTEKARFQQSNQSSRQRSFRFIAVIIVLIALIIGFNFQIFNGEKLAEFVKSISILEQTAIQREENIYERIKFQNQKKQKLEIQLDYLASELTNQEFRRASDEISIFRRYFASIATGISTTLGKRFSFALIGQTVGNERFNQLWNGNVYDEFFNQLSGYDHFDNDKKKEMKKIMESMKFKTKILKDTIIEISELENQLRQIRDQTNQKWALMALSSGFFENLQNVTLPILA